jgi:1,2-diacylglycerol 3-alpha-glucosyltransferase
MSASPGATRVFFPCTGLGREARGFEAFTRECAAALAPNPEIQLTVFGGGGDLRSGEREAWSLSRSGVTARAIGSLLDRDPYFVEQATFFIGFVGVLMAQRPDLVYFGDLNLGNACWHWRRISGQRFKLLYYNGGPTTKPFTRCDVVQQVSPEHLDSALARGEARERQVLLPHGVAITKEFHQASREERLRIRAELGVPADRPLVLSVGALNTSHKRLDYVISEVATMQSLPHLLLLGAETPETPAVRAAAAERLGNRCTIRTLPREKVRAAYRAADVFVLASLHEGFGLVQVEALDAGLPCIVHDTPTSAYIVGQSAQRANLQRVGALAPLLERAISPTSTMAGGTRQRHEYAYKRFSWDVLAPRYAALFRDCVSGRKFSAADDVR